VAVALAPVRSEPSERAEQTTQWHWHQKVLVTDSKPGWFYGTGQRDGYQGWVGAGQLSPDEGGSSEAAPLFVRSRWAHLHIGTEFPLGEPRLRTRSQRKHPRRRCRGATPCHTPKYLRHSALIPWHPLPMGRHLHLGHRLLRTYPTGICRAWHKPAPRCLAAGPNWTNLYRPWSIKSGRLSLFYQRSAPHYPCWTGVGQWANFACKQLGSHRSAHK